MSVRKEIFSIYANEKIILRIRKKSETSFFEYFFYLYIHIIPLFQIFGYEKKYDNLIISNKRVFLSINNRIIRDVEFKNYGSLNYDSKSSRLHFIDIMNKNRYVDLSAIRIKHKEIQHLKSKLNE